MTKAYVIEEGTKNLVTNPSGEIASTGVSFSVVTGGGSYSRVPANLHGDLAWEIIRNDTLGFAYMNQNLSGSRKSIPHTFSLTVQCTQARRVQLEYVFWQESTLLGNPRSPATELTPNKPERLSFTETPPVGTDRLELRLRFTQPDNQEGVYLVDGWQLEEKPYATTYCDGDMGEGYSWEGEPHASASIREPSSISMPSPDPKSLYVRYSEDGENWINSYNVFEDKEDIEPSLLLSPEDSRDPNGQVTPAIAGGVRVVDGEHGPAWQVAEPTENLVPNPEFSYSVPLGGWNLQAINATVENGYVKLVATDESSASIFASETIVSSAWSIKVTAGQTYTQSIEVKLPVGKSVELAAYYRSSANTYTGTIQTMTAQGTGDWKRYSLTSTAPEGAVAVAFLVYLFSTGRPGATLVPGEECLVRRPQFEQKGYATPFASGDMGAGFAWTGTPHASSSVRDSAYVFTTVWQPKADGGAYIVRYSRHSERGSNPYIISTGSTTNLFLSVHNNYSFTAPVVYVGGNAISHTFTPTSIPAPSVGEHVSLAMRWDRNQIDLSTSLGGESIADVSGTSIVDGTGRVVLGGFGSSSQGNVTIESAVFFDTPISEDEAHRLMNIDETLTWENSSSLKVRLNLGDHSELTRYEGAIKLKTTKKLYIGTVIGFSRPLSTKEIEILDSTPLEYISGKTLLNLPETTVGVSQLL